MSKKHVKEEIIMWWHMHFFRNAPKSKMFIFCFSIETPHFRNAPLLYVRFIWHARFSHLILWIGKMGHFKLNFAFKSGKFWEKTKNKPKMNIFDFWTFRKNAYSMHYKFFFHMLFGAFHIIPVKQSISDWRFDQVVGAYLCRCNFNRLTLF